MLININDITGWQGLFLADAAGYGVDTALADDGYNRSGYLESQATIEKMFADADTTGLTGEQLDILDGTEASFQHLFDQDDWVVSRLRDGGLDAMPEIMDSVNGGEAVDAWSAVYDDMSAFGDSLAKQDKALRVDLASVASRGRLMVYVGLFLVVVAGMAVVVSVTRSITRPLGRAIGVLQAVAAGDLATRFEEDRRDEIGQLATALNSAVGDLGDTMSEIAGTEVQLAGASEELPAVSGQMTGSASDASAQAGLVSSAAGQVSTNVQTVAAATEQMGASIREIAVNASNAAGVAARAVVAAESTTATVAKLGDSSSEVGEVDKVISSISEQTNLLALNATIEAARAG